MFPLIVKQKALKSRPGKGSGLTNYREDRYLLLFFFPALLYQWPHWNGEQVEIFHQVPLHTPNRGTFFLKNPKAWYGNQYLLSPHRAYR